MNRELGLKEVEKRGPALIERDRELANLIALARSDHTDGGHIALVYGEAGVGKSSLIDRFREVVGDNRKVLLGRSDPLASSRPFGPLHDMSQDVAKLLSEANADGRSRLEVLNAIVASLISLDPSAVLIFEDAHWIDQSTADLLQYLCRRIADQRFLIMITYRNDEIVSGHPLQTFLGALPQFRVQRCPLPALSVAGVASMAECSDKRARAIHALTAGNPFYVRQLIEAEGDLPTSVGDLLAARLGGLPPDLRDLIEVVSISPEPVSTGILDRVLGQESMTTALECVERGMLVEHEGGKFFPRHELARLAIYERISEASRRALHRSYFEAYAGSNNRTTLAVQLHHADAARDAEAVLNVVLEAADGAARLGAHSEAFQFASIGLKYLSDADDVQTASITETWAGSACVSTFMDENVNKARLDAARLRLALGQNTLAADNLRWLSRLCWYQGKPDEAKEHGLRSIELLEATGEDAARALALALKAQLFFLELEMDEAITMAQSAIDLAIQVGDLESEIHALNTLGAARCFLGNNDGVDLIRKSIEMAERVTFDQYRFKDADLARGYLNLVDHAADFRDFNLADNLITEGTRRCSEIDFDAWVNQLAGRRAEIFLEQGRLAEADGIARRALDYEAITPQPAQRIALVCARAVSRMGDKAAGDQLRDCLDQAIKTQDKGQEIATRLAIVEYSFLQSDNHRASQEIDQLLSIAERYFHKWNRGQLYVWAKHFSATTRVKPGEIPLGYAQELDGEIEAAVDWFLNSDLPFESILCVLRNVELSTPDALKAASDLAVSIGARPAEDALGRLNKQSHPVRKRGPYRAARKHPLGLTKREVEVLEILALGATNRQIAEQLCRSIRTVDRHVSTLIKKLNVTNRVDIIIRLNNEPWILQPVEENPNTKARR